jgi:hypothetical protein
MRQLSTMKTRRSDSVIADFTHLPIEALRLSRKLKITSFKIEPAASEKNNLDALFRGFKDVKFLSDVPDINMYYSWDKKM